jgi:kynurenine formamidase
VKLVDISHVLSEQTPVYPGDAAVKLEKVKTLEKDRYTAYLLSSGLHAATHIDIPMQKYQRKQAL